MFSDHCVGKVIAERLAELFSAESKWNDRQWRIGTVESMNECIAGASSNASETRLQYVIGTTRRIIEKDPFLEGRARGDVLKSIPKSNQLKPGSHSFFVLKHEIDDLTSKYFEMIDSGVSRINESDAASSADVDFNLWASYIAGHLQSLGLSDEWIVNHLNYHLKHNPNIVNLRHTLALIGDLWRKGSGPYTFLIPLTARARFDHQTPPPWLSKNDFEDAFAEYFPGESIPTHVGGFIVTVDCYDKYMAVSVLMERLETIAMKIRAAGETRRALIDNMAFMYPGYVEIDLVSNQKSATVTVPALDVGGGITLLHPLEGKLEAALDLLASVDGVSQRSACVTAWAMIETLFADADDFGGLAMIADRAADLLTCMYTVDLFHGIGSGHRKTEDDQLADNLNVASESERLGIVVDAFVSGVSIPGNWELGVVDCRTAKGLIVDVRGLTTLRTEFSDALRRLYDVRNQIVHAGINQPHGLRFIFNSALSLQSAIMNEAIRNASSSKGSTGLLAAKCTWLLNRVDDGSKISALSVFRQ
ncbi:hypothetical protein HQO38_18835 [Rhodococcus fascians]|nr:hypothetical protein [Rhodococcus fascians]MBY4140513.1 hypothetical protein [Rhodococcus fascians]MBY4219019.1 hypothetical protein [Rhodococcus fascians]MBY4221971.1 hypothetical protein [Rhodococcus fascians]MBY4233972.1 hypothetical protein [Rhodococcus fascians]